MKRYRVSGVKLWPRGRRVNLAVSQQVCGGRTHCLSKQHRPFPRRKQSSFEAGTSPTHPTPLALAALPLGSGHWWQVLACFGVAPTGLRRR
ncbi:unnamed protein product [Protopolystoma xenopodis]|uniref:Uncharacterized protein n=1 Tax=Protopolystoma xenopodis TaxID=117903 RepID=A0A448XQ47_9PLAT|nr:unnamed protein product [Protopolystoma xenopodis]